MAGGLSLQAIQQLFRPLAARVRLIASRCVIKTVNDAPRGQEVQIRILAGELVGKAERFTEYGFTSHPFPEAEGVAISLGGSRDHVIVVATEDRNYRIHLAQGEVSLYDDQGQVVTLKRGGEVFVKASTICRIEAPLVRIEGDLEVTGDVLDNEAGTGATMAASRAVFNAHVHPENDSGGPTDPPTTQQ